MKSVKCKLNNISAYIYTAAPVQMAMQLFFVHTQISLKFICRS